MRQPVCPIVQLGYVVDDIEAAAWQWHRAMGAGPFFTGDSSTVRDMRYRGQPSKVQYAYALAYCGEVQIELIQQLNDAPSVFREASDRSGHGYHHFLPLVPDYDEAMERYREMGCEVAYTATSDALGRVAYLDGRSLFGHFIEIVDMSPTYLAGLERLKRLTAEWDGQTLLRPLRGGRGRTSRPPA